ncbi:MAG: DNA mismatch repair endonuclease MutL [Thermodesulfobacteriota bacterium]
MSLIRVLPENVATQIAAGEVVERPASVLREILDNSIDAAADRIEIHIEAGGCKLVRVSDNGIGMDRDDLLLCLERHATSKVRSVEDLISIGTLGFRGEAVPSIAAVSRMEITSRTSESISGHRIRIDGGRLSSIEEVGAPAGTVTAVRDLFFNTPARRKFLRAAKTETYHLLETLSRIALPYQDVSFRLREGERTLLHYPASESEEERLAMLLGRETAERMELVERAAGPVTVRAHLASPELNRSRGDRILFYVNGRSVRDRMLTRAVMEGYGRRLMKGRYPQVVVSLEMDPGLVDVNVHPTKQEVRFREGRAIFRAVVSAVDEGLFRTGGVIVNSEASASAGPGRTDSPQQPVAAESPAPFYDDPEPWEGPQSTVNSPHIQQSFRKRAFFVIGQLGNTYILCQTEEGLLLVDQHAAHERIVYEGLRRGIMEGPIQVQTFLIPKRIEFSAADAGALEEYAGSLARVGLEMEHFGGVTYLLRSVPPVLLNADLDAVLREAIGRLRENDGELDSGAALDEVLSVMACHGAVRAGKPLSMREMTSLLDELERTDLPTNCPHGRPVSRKISWRELERMFKRAL